MGRLIDADALKERFRKEQMSMDEHGREFSSCFIGYGNNLSTSWDCVEDIVDSMPTIEERILDKIRAEVEQLRLHKAQFLTNDNKVCIDSQEVLEIIDKYKAESEEGAENGSNND